MINMMKDILQYVPYALFLAAVFALLAGGAIYILWFFAATTNATAKRKPPRRKYKCFLKAK